jgi:hypothetical protein
MYTDGKNIHGLDMNFSGPKVEKKPEYNPSTSFGEKHHSRARRGDLSGSVHVNRAYVV